MGALQIGSRSDRSFVQELMFCLFVAFRSYVFNYIASQIRNFLMINFYFPSTVLSMNEVIDARISKKTISQESTFCTRITTYTSFIKEINPLNSWQTPPTSLFANKRSDT